MKKRIKNTSLLIGGQGVDITGNIDSSTDITIGCYLKGNVTCAACVCIEEGACIVGDIVAKSVTVCAATVRGNIIADSVELLSGCNSEGNITAKTLVADEGTIINGRCEVSGIVPEDSTTE